MKCNYALLQSARCITDSDSQTVLACTDIAIRRSKLCVLLLVLVLIVMSNDNTKYIVVKINDLNFTKNNYKSPITFCFCLAKLMANIYIKCKQLGKFNDKK